MQRAIVVYESMFGNTRTIAKAVADGLSECLAVDLSEVSDAPSRLPDDASLVIVGGPTHAFGLSRPRTRADAAGRAERPLVSRGDGLREWLGGLAGGSSLLSAAGFDTRIDKPRLPGSAAKAAERRLRRVGFRIIVPAMSFYVSDTLGPLLDGETDRARRWGERIAPCVVGVGSET
jgi:Flavodoxin